ncbi:MAG TPA: hypothetical protein VIF12_06165 [Micavibrio sp.]
MQKENLKREFNNQQNIAKIDTSLQELTKAATPEEQKPGTDSVGMGDVVAKAAQFAAGAVLLPTIPIAAVNLAGNALNGASFLKTGYTALNGDGNKSRGHDEEPGYQAISPTPGTMEYAKVSAENNPVNMPRDTAAFRTAQKNISSGLCGIHESASIASSSLEGMVCLNLKTQLEEKRALYMKSMDNVGDIQIALDRRKGGVPLTASTLDVALSQDQSLFKVAKQGVVMNA